LFAKDGWEILILEDLGPKSVPPWPPRKTRSIVHSFAQFRASNKGKPLPEWLKRPAEWFGNDLSWSWTTLRPSAIERAGVAGESAPEAADWYAANGVLLGSASKRLLGAEHPQLLHADARSDNLRWKDGRLYLVDWAEAFAGPPEFDAAAFIQTIAVESTFAPETILEWYQEVNPLEPSMVDAAVVAVAGFFADRAWMPELPGLPRLRTFQKQQLVVSLKWALQRLGMEEPGWLDAVLAA
jgi:Ser/Thr protein kinase RdoA (MazF antagonist)